MKRLAVLLAAALAATLAPATAHAASLPAPGTVLSESAGSFYLDPARATTAPATVRHLQYVSTDEHGRRVAVSGTLLTPTAPWTGRGVRPLVTYAVGTQGMADRCAPSAQFATGSDYEGPFVGTLVQQGYAVVVTDYQGLGTPGVHAYTNSQALGHDVLDAARAAKRVTVDRAPAKAPVLVAGYSEGGNAAAAALEQRRSYAPDVNVVAGYAGAVPADLAQVAPGLDGSPYTAFLAYAIVALDDGYPDLHIADLLTPQGRAFLQQANDSCLVDGLALGAFKQTKDYTKSGQPLTAYLSRPDIAAVLGSLKLGSKAPDVPVVIAHSLGDDVIPHAQDAAMARSWCAKGAQVQFDPGVVPTHVAGQAEGFPKALAFFATVIHGGTPPSNCGGF